MFFGIIWIVLIAISLVLFALYIVFKGAEWIKIYNNETDYCSQCKTKFCVKCSIPCKQCSWIFKNKCCPFCEICWKCQPKKCDYCIKIK